MGVFARRGLAALGVLTALQLAFAASASAEGDQGSFNKANLVSDLAGMAPVTDPNLVNPWGLSHGPTTPWWVSDNNANVATLYNGAGQPFPPGHPLVVNIPGPTGSPPGPVGTPTGNVFNGQPTEFNVSAAGKTGSSLFIFATEDGTIAGWSPAVDLANAVIAVDKSTIPTAADGAVYKGLALAPTEDGDRLFAANFRSGQVDVFDTNFNPVVRPDAFVDPTLPPGYAPFDIAAIGGRLYVTYALQKADKHDDQSGPGNGFVDVYSTDGHLLKHLLRRGQLNSPWGLALAPENFGAFSGDLLVGNFGDGLINVYEPRSGHFEGTISHNGTPIQTNGLWGIAFGNGGNAGPANSLFFTAGIFDETHGLFGVITAQGEQER